MYERLRIHVNCDIRELVKKGVRLSSFDDNVTGLKTNNFKDHRKKNRTH